MPRNGSNVYSLPAGSLVTNGDTSDATDLNTPLQDIEADLNAARPIVAGGTGATSASAARTNLGLGTSATKDVTGADAAVVSGTAGSDGQVGQWNADGDLVGADLAGVSSLTSTSSGTSFDFTSIPIGVVRIDVCFVGVSLSGTNSLLVQIGDSGGIEATGYNVTGEVAGTPTDYATGFGIPTNGAATAQHGTMTLTLADASTNTWTAQCALRSGSGAVSHGGGSKALSATLDRVRVTRSGSDNFDAGSISVRWSKV